MEFVIDKKRLDSVVSLLNNYVEKRDNSSKNSNIFISANSEQITLLASDGEMGINYRIYGANVIEGGEAYVHAKKLNDILKGLDNSDLNFKCLEKSAKITQDKTKFSIPLMSEGDFKFMDENEAREQINLSSSALSKGLKMINSAIDSSSASLQFSSAHIEICENEVNFAGSDTKIVCVYTIANTQAKRDTIALSKRCVGELLKLLNEEVRIYKSEHYLLIENDNFTFYASAVNVDLMPYRAVMPKHEIKHQIVLKKSQFLNEIKKLNTISDKSLITFSAQDKITFTNQILETDNATAVISEIEQSCGISEDFGVYLSNKHMLDFLNSCESDTFVIDYFAPGAPVVFKTDNFTALIACIKQ